MSEAGKSVAGMEEVLRTAEESADAANLLALEAVLGRFEAASPREGGGADGGQLVLAAERAARATADMARLMGAAGLF